MPTRENFEERPGDVENLIQHSEPPEASHSGDVEEIQEEDQVTVLSASIFNYRERQIDKITLRQSQNHPGYGSFAGSLNSKR